MTKKSRTTLVASGKRNPFTQSVKEAEEKFWEAIHDPDPNSLEIAIDALQEQNVELWMASQDAIDPLWLSGERFDTQPAAAGVFEIGTTHPHVTGWWSNPAERRKRLNDPEYVIVEWIVTPIVQALRQSVAESRSVTAPLYTHEVYFWRQSEGWGELADSERYSVLQDAIDDAVEKAWRVVQAIKEGVEGYRQAQHSNKAIAKSVFYRASQFEDPTDGESEHSAPAGGAYYPQENPPHQGTREAPAFEHGYWRDAPAGHEDQSRRFIRLDRGDELTPRQSSVFYAGGWGQARIALQRSPELLTDDPGKIAVAIDALLEGRTMEGMHLAGVLGPYTAQFENFDVSHGRHEDRLSKKLDPRWDKELIASQAAMDKHDRDLWQQGYVNYIIDQLERRAGLRENPAKPLLQVADEFYSLLLDPDPHSLKVAEDLLLENDTTLAAVSTLVPDDVYEHAIYGKQTSRLGVFNLGAKMGSVMWKVTNTSTGNKFFVELFVTPPRGVRAPTDRYRLSATGTITEAPPNIQVVVPQRFNTAAEATHQVVEHAWYCVKKIKHDPTLLGKPLNTILNELGGALTIKGTYPSNTPKAVINPPMTQEQAIEKFQELLLDTDPNSMDVAKDVLEQAGVTMSHASSLASPDYSINYEEAGGAAGMFVLGTDRYIVWGPLPGYIDGVRWSVLPDADVESRLQKFNCDVGFFFAGLWRDVFRVQHRRSGRRVGGGSMGGFPFSTLAKARTRTVQEAWRAAKMMKHKMYEPDTTADSLAADIRIQMAHPTYPFEGLDPTVNPCSTTVHANPSPWVTKHLADSWVTLESQVPPAWMPKLDKTVGKGKRMSAEIPEYGCGAYGCVIPTGDPKIVLKVTTDDTEAQFAARLAKTLPVPIVTKYELVLHLPTAKRQGRDVFLLWREAADDVGNVDKVVGNAAEEAIGKQHAAAQAAFSLLHEGEPAEHELAEWRRQVIAMGKVPALKWLADGMVRAYDERGIFISDVHAGNLGRARGEWVITDPGNVAVVKK